MMKNNLNKSFLNLVEESIKGHWELPGFTDLNGKTYRYKDIAHEIEKLHILFEEAGIKKGDKIALVGRNSSNWAILFFGTLAYGAVIVPILHDFKPDNILHIINHSGARIVMASNNIWENLDPSVTPDVLMYLSIEDFSILHQQGDKVYPTDEERETLFQKKYPSFSPNDIHYYKEDPEELALLNYTSGTTSSSKGVMLPFRSLWSNTEFATTHLPFVHPGDNIICMLPMAHMYGLAFEVLNSVCKGCHIHFLGKMPTPKILGEAFVTIRPKLILAVPLIIEKIVKNKIFPIVKKPHMQLLLKLPLIGNLVKKEIAKKLETAFGGNFGELIIGGAAMNQEVEEFLQSIHFRYTIGYGMTECGPLVSYEQWDTYKAGSIGRAVDRVEIKIDPENQKDGVGEILVRGDNVMLGYYKDPEMTRQSFTADNWLRTGDLGTIDNEGFLFIRGRCKTMILSSNGQNIYPEEIESLLNDKPYVAESLVITEAGKLKALIYPNQEQIKKGKKTEKDIQQIMQRNIDQLNKELPGYSKISSFTLQKEEFVKTPKQSIKRYIYQK